MEGAERDEWFRESHPCVFLENGRCSIYKVRPVACRSYFVINDPSLCQPDNKQTILHIDNSAYLDMTLRRGLMIHMALDLKETEQRILMGTLPRIVLLALEAMDHNDYRKLIRSQSWPTASGLSEWIDKGKNPFQKERLYQIRTSKDAPTT